MHVQIELWALLTFLIGLLVYIASFFVGGEARKAAA